MGRVALEVLLIIALLLANGLFAMSEAAVVSARKARLQHRADEGDEAARRALELANHPNRFLSTVQVGITLIGILAGAFGGATLAAELARVLARNPALEPYADAIGLGVVVLAITYLSLIIGELVPKRIALNAPERIAALVAGPMHALSVISAPLVRLLGFSTDAVLAILRVRKTDEPPVTEEEINVLMEQGTQAGVFEPAEQDIVERVFWLGDQQVASLMTPRRRIVWLDVDAPAESYRAMLIQQRYTRLVACEGTIDRVVGFVKTRDVLACLLDGGQPDLRSVLQQPLFIPETMRALRVLELFRSSGTHLAMVIDEYGGIEGMVTLTDLVEEIVGELASLSAGPDPRVVQREDGSWLVDASLSMEEVREAIGLPERRQEERDDYHTLGGFILKHLGRLPSTADHFVADGFRFEVVDMDGKRVDKVLIAHPTPAQNH